MRKIIKQITYVDDDNKVAITENFDGENSQVSIAVENNVDIFEFLEIITKLKNDIFKDSNKEFLDTFLKDKKPELTEEEKAELIRKEELELLIKKSVDVLKMDENIARTLASTPNSKQTLIDMINNLTSEINDKAIIPEVIDTNNEVQRAMVEAPKKTKQIIINGMSVEYSGENFTDTVPHENRRNMPYYANMVKHEALVNGLDLRLAI